VLQHRPPSPWTLPPGLTGIPKAFISMKDTCLGSVCVCVHVCVCVCVCVCVETRQGGWFPLQGINIPDINIINLIQ
jgi:hypothetical protein